MRTAGLLGTQDLDVDDDLAHGRERVHCRPLAGLGARPKGCGSASLTARHTAAAEDSMSGRSPPTPVSCPRCERRELRDVRQIRQAAQRRHQPRHLLFR